MALATYSSADVIVIVNNVQMSGTADGDFCKVEYQEDAYKLMIGADGTPGRARNANQSGTIEITLMSTSPSNDILSAQAEADRLLGTGVGSAMVKDLFGSTIWTANQCWVKKSAATTFGKEINTRVWVLEVPYLVGHVGGDADV